MKKIHQQIHDLELSLMSADVRLSSKDLGRLLADDFMEFGSSGQVYYKKDILKRVPKTASQVKYLMSNFKAKELSEDVVISTFKTRRIINKEIKVSLRSSLWRKNGNVWKIFFHQGTPILK